jgi:hypothetical protein
MSVTYPKRRLQHRSPAPRHPHIAAEIGHFWRVRPVAWLSDL